ncbi:GGDEF domain-containing protein [Campylobacter canadensis]|uniref:diguanylate cyclase n=1 Tax=Campylobacter canadensis TaxID=449520 RepID=A0ABS7WRD7_9BACT|nr:GGDEF domain-containing protein [Campylobacter canadensis]MBZ7986514.1 GGDEF domain-containing protein [Campylobacter canadensis]MBZ7994081.1 GGDEF domain-containing protein [Campylobacter canadensis]MBZ7995916.1 GGDEF domain-containing protein [Campylobacter canadensis]MBZ7997550.1 GGDEF domain-containing protein [Campylobacter canadensis]MBZ7999412.1 GGDEF domain-containing protein [Campylobacter canadensis]
MSANINEIAKETILELTKRNLLLTPENYTEVFNEVAKKHGRVTLTSDKLQTYISKLNNNINQDLKYRNIKTLDELIIYLITQVNNVKNQDDDKKLIHTYNILLKIIFQIFLKVPFKNIKEVVKNTYQPLTNNSIDVVKNIWQDKSKDILNELDETLEQAVKLGYKEEEDMLLFLNSLNKQELKEGIDDICLLLAPVIVYALTPSISETNSEISNFCEQITNNPLCISKNNFADAIKDFIQKRIDLDRAEITSSNKVLNDILGHISEKIGHILTMATTSAEKIQAIRSEIEKINSNDSAMQMIKAKLLAIVKSFESEIVDIKSKATSDFNVLDELKVKVSKLEQEITNLRSQSQIDFLTQLANKRLLEEKLKLAEDSFDRYNINYSVVFFDIDYFKNINDTYGHIAGDTILAQIGNIILSNIRKLDCAGRWGGEEFMVVLPHTSKEDAFKFAQKVRLLVQEQKFQYKNQQIVVRISGGVSDRLSFDSQEKLIEAVDSLLYSAKQAGRNQVKC